MIEVAHLSRRFGRHEVIKDVTFHVERGEIVAILGPNESGKTTLLRMLSGYLPGTQGRVLIGGRDVALDALEVRRRIGYLPETAPLPADMRVADYLRFRALLKGVPRSRAADRVQEALACCGLQDSGRKRIAHLSRGCRQRVALADTLVHDPDLLLLDAPAFGLDSHQAHAMFQLIRELAAAHTILLSSLQWEEADRLCHRVFILHAGRLVAAGTPAALRAQCGGVRITAELQTGDEQAAPALAALPGVRHLSFSRLPDGWTRYELTVDAGAETRHLLHRKATAEGWPLRVLCEETCSLEDVYARLTRDDIPAETETNPGTAP